MFESKREKFLPREMFFLGRDTMDSNSKTSEEQDGDKELLQMTFFFTNTKS